MSDLHPIHETRIRKRRKMLVADLLCGAGGSSTGAERALAEMGLEMELVCVNHWDRAIATHEKNHPTARHFIEDIAACRPHMLVPEGYLDLLMASPTCTYHSVARGGKPTSDQQRSDPWHIITWLTELRVKRVIIENVWEFIGWGPIDTRTGKPIKSRKGEYFRAWIKTMEALGFKLEWHKLNAADFGDATTRNRFILMGRSDGKRIVWPMPTHAKRDGKASDLFASGLKPWRPAREIIDWNLKGRSIFNRKKPLAAKTLLRIHAGAVKLNWPEPFIVVLRNHMAAQGIDVPLPAITAGGTHIGIAEPVIISPRHGKEGAGPRPRGVNQPLPTLTAGGSQFGVAEPAIISTAHGADAVERAPHARRARSAEEPLGTIHAGGGNFGIAEPVILSSGSYGAPRSAEDPLPTITTGGAGTDGRPGCARPAVVEPFILNRHGAGYSKTRAHPIDEPTPTATCDGGGYLVEAFVLSQASGGAPRAVGDPLPTIVTGGERGSGTALIAPYYSTGSGETCSSAEDPLPTVTTKGRFGMVVPVTHSAGGNQARDIGNPLPTITTAKGGEFAVVVPVTHDGGDERHHDPADPLPTITGANRGELAIADVAEGYDILFRMLEPEELAAAMGFTDDDYGYEFTGTKTERVKQVGNAVSVRKMRACVAAIMADAAPTEREVPIVFQEAAE